MKKTVAVVVMVVAVVTFVAVGADAKGRSARVQGKKLVKVLWSDMKAGRWEKLQKMMAPGFQSVHEDGARNRAKELNLIKGLNMGKYRLSKIKVTEVGTALIVTYKAAVSETIGGKQLPKTVAPRMSVFVKEGDTWLWAAHANLNPAH